MKCDHTWNQTGNQPHFESFNDFALLSEWSCSGDVRLAEIDGPVVKLELVGACGTCPSSSMVIICHGCELQRLNCFIFSCREITSADNEARAGAKAQGAHPGDRGSSADIAGCSPTHWAGHPDRVGWVWNALLKSNALLSLFRWSKTSPTQLVYNKVSILSSISVFARSWLWQAEALTSYQSAAWEDCRSVYSRTHCCMKSWVPSRPLATLTYALLWWYGYSAIHSIRSVTCRDCFITSCYICFTLFGHSTEYCQYAAAVASETQ